MKPKIWNDITNILAKLASSKDYDPRVKYDTSLEYYGNQIPVLPKPGAGDNGKSVVAKTDGTYELKKPAVTPADIIAATGEMTSQQAATTLTNIGGEPKKLIVNITDDVGGLSADKDLHVIQNAFVDGITVVAIYGYSEYYLMYSSYDDEEVYFISINEAYTSADIVVSLLYASVEDDHDIWIETHWGFKSVPDVITDLLSTSITVTPVDNAVYEYGELTSLTITNFPTPGKFCIWFNSGNTPSTVTGINNSDGTPFQPEADKKYRIIVENGYATFDSWTVPR